MEEFGTSHWLEQVSTLRRYLTAVTAAALFALAACGSSAATATTGSPTPQTATGPAGQVYRIGQSFVLPGSNDTGSFRLTVDSVSSTVSPSAVRAYADSLGGSLDTKPDPGHKWAIVGIHGTNVGNQPAFFLTQFFVLTAGGKQFAVSLSDSKAQHVAEGYNDIKNVLISSELNPGQTGYEWVVYQVPKDLPLQSILVGADGTDGPFVTVDLTHHR